MAQGRHAGRVAIVTGAGSGIGRAAALLLAREGAIVVGCDVSEAGLAETAALAAAEGATAHSVTADVTRQSDVDAVVAAAAALGPVEILANVAGIMDHFMPVGDLDDDLWDRVLAINLTGPMRMCRAVMPVMVEAGHGDIVNVASTAALHRISAGAAYASSKHGLVGLTLSIAYMYGDKGIRCNAVCPAAIDTPINDAAVPRVPWVGDIIKRSIGRVSGVVAPERISGVISWLASEEASYVNGAILTADGGFTSG